MNGTITYGIKKMNSNNYIMIPQLSGIINLFNATYCLDPTLSNPAHAQLPQNNRLNRRMRTSCSDRRQLQSTDSFSVDVESDGCRGAMDGEKQICELDFKNQKQFISYSISGESSWKCTYGGGWSTVQSSASPG